MLQETLSEVVPLPSSFTLGGSGQDGVQGRGVRSHMGAAGGGVSAPRTSPIHGPGSSDPKLGFFWLWRTEPPALDPTGWHTWGPLRVAMSV